MPVSKAPVDRTDDESSLELDIAKNQKFRMAAAAADQESLDDSSKYHFFQGQKHHEHAFSLMDPVHPAKHHEQGQHYDVDLPMFDPSMVM